MASTSITLQFSPWVSPLPMRASAVSRSLRKSGRGLNRVLAWDVLTKENELNLDLNLSCSTGDVAAAGAAADPEPCSGCGANCTQHPQQPALFAWVMVGGKNLTPVRRCCLGGPHPGTSRSWRQLCHRIGHSGISKHAEMAAIAALQPETLHEPIRRRLTLVVIRLRTVTAQPAPRAGKARSSSGNERNGETRVELGLARPCDECSKVICALGCFKRVIYSASDGRLVSVAPEELLQFCLPSSGKRMQQKDLLEARSRGTKSNIAGSGDTVGAAMVPAPIAAPSRRRAARRQRKNHAVS